MNARCIMSFLQISSKKQKEKNMCQKNSVFEIDEASVPVSIYQKNPVRTKKIRKNDFPDKGWDTVLGAQREAHKLKYCLIRNKELANRPYTWFATINFHDVSSPKSAAASWKKSCRKLKEKGAVGGYIREVNTRNRLHYHLLFRSEHTKETLAAIINRSLPDRSSEPWHMNLKKVRTSDWDLFAYLGKSKVPGKNAAGKMVEDRYAEKRLLMKKKIGLRKLGAFGFFWIKSRVQLWKENIATSKRIDEGLQVAGVREEVQATYERHNGRIPLREIERELGYHAATKSIA